MEDLHRGDGAEEGYGLPVADDRWLSKRQVGDIWGRQMVSQRRDYMWHPSRVAGRTTCLERHVWRLPALGPTCWNEHRLRGWRTCLVCRWKRQNPGAKDQWESVMSKASVGQKRPENRPWKDPQNYIDSEDNRHRITSRISVCKCKTSLKNNNKSREFIPLAKHNIVKFKLII